VCSDTSEVLTPKIAAEKSEAEEPEEEPQALDILVKIRETIKTSRNLEKEFDEQFRKLSDKIADQKDQIMELKEEVEELEKLAGDPQEIASAIRFILDREPDIKLRTQFEVSARFFERKYMSITALDLRLALL